MKRLSLPVRDAARDANLGEASEALERAESDLRDLPLTAEVRELHRRRTALHLVVERLVFGRRPILTETQISKLVSDVASLANDAANARGRFPRE